MDAKNKNADPGKGSAARGTCDQMKSSTTSGHRTPRVIILNIEHERRCRAPSGGICTCDDSDDGDHGVATLVGNPSLSDMMEWIR